MSHTYPKHRPLYQAILLASPFPLSSGPRVQPLGCPNCGSLGATVLPLNICKHIAAPNSTYRPPIHWQGCRRPRGRSSPI